MRSDHAHSRKASRGRHDRPQKRKTPQAEHETNEQNPLSLRAQRSNPHPRKNVQNRTGKRIAAVASLLRNDSSFYAYAMPETACSRTTGGHARPYKRQSSDIKSARGTMRASSPAKNVSATLRRDCRRRVSLAMTPGWYLLRGNP